jgi:hypothetical protein
MVGTRTFIALAIAGIAWFCKTNGHDLGIDQSKAVDTVLNLIGYASLIGAFFARLFATTTDALRADLPELAGALLPHLMAAGVPVIPAAPLPTLGDKQGGSATRAFVLTVLFFAAGAFIALVLSSCASAPPSVLIKGGADAANQYLDRTDLYLKNGVITREEALARYAKVQKAKDALQAAKNALVSCVTTGTAEVSCLAAQAALGAVPSLEEAEIALLKKEQGK